MKPRRRRPALTQMPGSLRIIPEPYGVVLVMSPWNYPFLLALGPLIGAIAAGNTIVLKPSAYSPATSAVLEQVLSTIEPGWVEVVTGGREENQTLLDQKFDFIIAFKKSKDFKKMLEILIPLANKISLSSFSISGNKAHSDSTDNLSKSSFFRII